MPASMETLNDWLARAEQLHPKNIELGLERAKEMAGRLGLKFGCPVITVAGTNGKGSTCAMLESIALQAGYRTAVSHLAAPRALRGALRSRASRSMLPN
jgi:dihydrofolate synthase/folylpolyglutamate synthase